MINYHDTGKETIVEQVQVINLENTAYLPKGRCIKGMLAGNDSWHSSEGHFKGELSKPSDIFFFAAVCIYAMLGYVIFGADEDLQKHESQGLNGLMKHVGDEEVNRQVLRFLWDDRVADYHSYKPFSDWPNVNDNKFKDVIHCMTNLNPQKWATAREVLKHPWFSGCELY
ncbi:hypothetical protein RJ035_007559 [Blastomyces gilchristii]